MNERDEAGCLVIGIVREETVRREDEGVGSRSEAWPASWTASRAGAGVTLLTRVAEMQGERRTNRVQAIAVTPSRRNQSCHPNPSP